MGSGGPGDLAFSEGILLRKARMAFVRHFVYFKACCCAAKRDGREPHYAPYYFTVCVPLIADRSCFLCSSTHAPPVMLLLRTLLGLRHMGMSIAHHVHAGRSWLRQGPTGFLILSVVSVSFRFMTMFCRWMLWAISHLEEFSRGRFWGSQPGARGARGKRSLSVSHRRAGDQEHQVQGGHSARRVLFYFL